MSIKACQAALCLTVVAASFSSATAQAQVAVRPWFVGGGSFGTGDVDNFLTDVAEVVQARQQPTQQAVNSQPPGRAPAKGQPQNPQPGGRPTPAASAPENADLSAGKNAIFSPRKLGQVYLNVPQGDEALGTQRVPRSLSSREFDPVTGKIRWPQVFLHEKYKTLRTTLEGLLAKRTGTGPTPALATATHDVIVRMIEMLRSDIEELPANDYMAARKFIDALDFAVVAPAPSR